MLNISDGLTLERLDATLRTFISFCAAYHGERTSDELCVHSFEFDEHTEQYLQSPLQMEHACDLLIASELFQFHSQRMTGILFSDTQKVRVVTLSFSLLSVDRIAGDRPPRAADPLCHPTGLWAAKDEFPT